MNLFVEPRYIEALHRLALGLEPLDAMQGGRIAHPIQVIIPEKLQGLPRPDVERHDSCLHVLRYQPGVNDKVNLRFFEDARRFVPRQIQYPILTIVQADALNYKNRVRRPVLFPGAAYDSVSLSTGIRGRVERNGKPLRWVRVEARLVLNGTVIGRAQGDDRGEFYLLLSSAASPAHDLTDPVKVLVEVFGPTVDPVPANPNLPSLDKFWDLPTEVAAVLDPVNPDDDSVSAGTVLPAGFSSLASKSLDVPLGTILSQTTTFVIP
jgi:hypothetical protein